MGYRLHATIPNVEFGKSYIELGKQYDIVWDSFNTKWFGEGQDSGMVDYHELEDFYQELIKINPEEGLYNLDSLKKYIDYCVKHKYDLYFTSF